MDSGLGSFALAFGAGFISFLSPCVLPLIPGYIGFVTGLSQGQLVDEHRKLSDVLNPILMFVAGFSLVFIALGASASALGAILVEYRQALTFAGGVFITAMGFFLLGLVKIPWLYSEARLDMAKARTFGGLASLLMGMAFAFGWTPCVGPILASVLALASTSTDVGRGAALLLAYSAGLGIPFIAVGVAFGRLGPALRFMNRYSLWVNRIAGVLLMVVGLLILTGRLGVLAGWLVRWFPFLGALG